MFSVREALNLRCPDFKTDDMIRNSPIRTQSSQTVLQGDLTDHIHLWLYGFRIFSSPVKDTFQLSLTVFTSIEVGKPTSDDLVHYRTRIIFRIGSYCLPYSHWIFNQQYSGYLVSTFSLAPTGLSPSTVLFSNRLRIEELG